MKLSLLPVFFLDLQTTGSNAENSYPLEIAYGTNADNFQHYLIQQTDEIPRRIQILTGITAEEMSGALPLKKILEHFCEFQKNQNYSVIHFAQFEKPFLRKIFSDAIPFSILCSHEIAKRLFPGLPARGIRGIAGYFGYRLESCKRALDHVLATEFIWKNLLNELAKVGVETESDLLKWLAQPAKKREKYIYPFQKEKRLTLPEKPGIYRMKNSAGEILYVGKATSLRSRVNSYFRGQKKRHPRTLELLTQVRDIEITACETALEAALLETDEIKKWDPPYNVVLKTGNRSLTFFSRELDTYSSEQSTDFPIGPFSSPLVFDSVLKLSHSLLENPNSVELMPDLFFDPIDTELLKAGYCLFCEQHSFPSHRFASMRAIVAQGLHWQRQGISDSKPEEPEEMKDIVTPEKLAARFQRHFIRAAKSYRRAKRFTRLLNCEIEFDGRTLYFENGHLTSQRGRLLMEKAPWSGMSIDTYDRISILLSELAKYENVVIR